MAEKILVTGGTGYIGSHTVVELVKSGFEPILIDDLSNSNVAVLSGIEKIVGRKVTFVKMDLKDGPAVKNFFDEHSEVRNVIHFAAYKSVGESVADPIKYYTNNLGSLLNILEYSKAPLNLIFSSSCTVYGQPDRLPVGEDAPFKRAESAYGNTKQMGEQILEHAAKAGKVRVVSLRYFNPVGAHESSLIGELPSGTPSNLVPFITQTAIGIRDHLTVFGNDYHTPDGTNIRDYLHVVDLARAHVAACKQLGEPGSKDFNTYNLGTGNGFSVLEVIKRFEKVTGQALAYEIGERRPGDVEQVYADASKAEKQLHWKALLSLDDMLLSAWNWEKQLRG